MPIHPSSPEKIAQAAALLHAGNCVAFPTETVYGLGADARNGEAVARIYELKGRPAFNPLIAHVATLEEAEKITVFDNRARLVAQRFWPGPLTLVLPLPKNTGISSLVTAGLDTIAVRIPSHPVAQALLQDFGGPIAAPSANRSGTLSPTTPLHVEHSFGKDAPFILAAGPSTIGLESTILDLSEPEPALLRPGGVTIEEIENCFDFKIKKLEIVTDKENKPKSPGLLLRHYAPKIPLRLKVIDIKPNEALLAFGPIRFMGVRGGGAASDLPENRIRNLSETGDLVEAAANLFTHLHALEGSGASQIAVMNIPNVGLGLAINDRLKRAATPE